MRIEKDGTFSYGSNRAAWIRVVDSNTNALNWRNQSNTETLMKIETTGDNKFQSEIEIQVNNDIDLRGDLDVSDSGCSIKIKDDIEHSLSIKNGDETVVSYNTEEEQVENYYETKFHENIILKANIKADENDTMLFINEDSLDAFEIEDFLKFSSDARRKQLNLSQHLAPSLSNNFTLGKDAKVLSGFWNILQSDNFATAVGGSGADATNFVRGDKVFLEGEIYTVSETFSQHKVFFEERRKSVAAISVVATILPLWFAATYTKSLTLGNYETHSIATNLVSFEANAIVYANAVHNAVSNITALIANVNSNIVITTSNLTLNSLRDVISGSNVDGQILIYDIGDHQWHNKNVSGAITITNSGVTTINSNVIINIISNVFAGTLANFATYNTNGIVTQTAANTFTGRSLIAGSGITISNANGVAGNPTIAQSGIGLIGYSGKDFINSFPKIGKPQSVSYDTGAPNNTLFYLGAGNEGVVRQVFFTGIQRSFDWLDFSNFNDLSLRIYVDQGNVSNFASISSTYLAANVPLGMLFGKDFTDNQVFMNNTKFIDTAISYLVSDSAYVPSVRLKFPIPFSNGITIQVYDNVVGAPSRTIFTWTGYELGTLPSGRYNDWRFKANYVSQSLSYLSSLTFLNQTANSGALLGMYASVDAPILGSGGQWVDNNWQFWFDGDSTGGTPSYQASGFEDWFFNPFNCRALGEYYGYEYGTFFANPGVSNGVAAYHFFDSFNVEWDSGAVGKFPYTHSSGPDITSFKVLTLFYAPM